MESIFRHESAGMESISQKHPRGMESVRTNWCARHGVSMEIKATRHTTELSDQQVWAAIGSCRAFIRAGYGVNLAFEADGYPCVLSSVVAAGMDADDLAAVFDAQASEQTIHHVLFDQYSGRDDASDDSLRTRLCETIRRHHPHRLPRSRMSFLKLHPRDVLRAMEREALLRDLDVPASIPSPLAWLI